MQRRPFVFALMLVLLFASQSVSAQQTTFRLGTGDKLRVTVFEEPDMSGEYSVSNSGTLSLPLIGEIQASDLSITQLEQAITAALADGFITDASVSIELVEARPFYILGDVANPGSYPYVGGMAVINAIALAGGSLFTEEDEVRIQVELGRITERRDLLIKNYVSALTRESRLISERDGQTAIQFSAPLSLLQKVPEIRQIIQAEQRIFEARRNGLEGEINIIEKLKEGVGKEIKAYNSQLAATRDQVTLINELLADQDKLLAQNLTRKTQVLELKIEAAEARISRGNLRVDLARAEQRLSELDLQVLGLRNTFLNEVVDNLNLTQQELSRDRTSLQTAQQELLQTQRKLGRARSAVAGQRSLRIVITRRSAQGTEQIDADEDTAIVPGDIVRVIDESALVLDQSELDVSSLLLAFAAEHGDESVQDTSAADQGAAAAPQTEPLASSAPTGDSAALPTEETETAESAPQDGQSDVAIPTETTDTAALSTQAAEAPSDQLPRQDLILAIQAGLNTLGQNQSGQSPGLTEDGFMGPQTRVAIRSYQEAHQLPVDGQPSLELLKHVEQRLAQNQ